jgi:hypothetical protein
MSDSKASAASPLLRLAEAAAPETSVAREPSIADLSAPSSFSQSISQARQSWGAEQTISAPEMEIGEKVLTDFVFAGMKDAASSYIMGSTVAREQMLPLSTFKAVFQSIRDTAAGYILNETAAKSSEGEPLKLPASVREANRALAA